MTLTSTNNITVIDNFLTTPDFKTIERLCYRDLSWKFARYKVHSDLESLENFQMVHTFVDTMDITKSSEQSEHLNPFMNKLHAQAVFRIKANLESWKGDIPFKSNFHVDNSMSEAFVRTVTGYEYRKVKDMTTGIYYLNTCNGYTEFEDGTIVNSVANRFVSFPAFTKHRGVSQTDTKTRIVINFNYWK